MATNNLAWMLATSPNDQDRIGAEAVIYAQRAVSFYREANNLDTLGAAYAEAHQFQMAVRVEGKAYQMSGNEGYKKLKEAYAKGITYAEYQKGEGKPSLLSPREIKGIRP